MLISRMSRYHILSMFFLACLALNVAPETAASRERTSNWCRVPSPPLRVIQAFLPQHKKNEDLTENNFLPTQDKQGWHYVDTVIFAGCVFGFSAISGSPRSTCVKTNGSSHAEWDGAFPACKRNICWWLGNETGIEFHNDNQLLTVHANGFPEGTQLIFTNWTCPSGSYAKNNVMLCHSSGTWTGSYPSCLTKAEKGESPDEIELRKHSNNFLIWASIMTVICIGMLASLIFLSYKLIKRSFKSRRQKRRSNLAPDATLTSLINSPTRDSERQIQSPNEEDYTYSVPGYYKCNCPHNTVPSAPKLRQVDILRGIQTQHSGSNVNPIPKPKRRNNPPVK